MKYLLGAVILTVGLGAGYWVGNRGLPGGIGDEGIFGKLGGAFWGLLVIALALFVAGVLVWAAVAAADWILTWATGPG